MAHFDSVIGALQETHTYKWVHCRWRCAFQGTHVHLLDLMRLPSSLQSLVELDRLSAETETLMEQSLLGSLEWVRCLLLRHYHCQTVIER